MRSLRFLLLAFLFLAATSHGRLPLTYNASDIWWVPEESGWGLNLIHQGNTLFGTLFVYGSDGTPRWYSASVSSRRETTPFTIVRFRSRAT
jgi:hypothetical protein